MDVKALKWSYIKITVVDTNTDEIVVWYDAGTSKLPVMNKV